MQTETNEPAVNNTHVIRESSVYSDIKKSVQSNDRSAFSLLLAMVTQDRMELDEFHLPQNKAPKNTYDLEKTFHVVPKKLIENVNNEQNLLFNQLLNSGCRESVNLLLNLHPQPLIQRMNDVESGVNIPAKLFNSLDVNQQAKFYREIECKNHTQQKTNKTEHDLTKTVDANVEMDVESWFSVLEQARTLSKVA